jgi:tRNA/tmRNA/rRNA uracil-C5-methylase (TrmA/RlmC/RlmD family)
VTNPGPLLGRRLELTVGPVAHGGHCVARVDDEPGGRVVFVRHALPGERVEVLVTEDAGGSYCRADAVTVLSAVEDRVVPPCPHAGAGRCGGCDWQHVEPSAQRRLKGAVVREQFQRLAGLDVDVEVEELPGGALGWRTRVAYAVDGAGRPGLRRHRSHQVELIQNCPLGVDGVGTNPALQQRWPGESGIELAAGDQGPPALLAHRPAPPPSGAAAAHRGRRRRPADIVRVVAGPDRLRHRVGELDFEVAATGFWQVHPAAALTFVTAVLQALAPRRGETALDLYAGAGLFTAALADAVGPTGRVIGVEASAQGSADARKNLLELPWASIEHDQVTAPLLQRFEVRADVVVLDPPRSGAGEAVIHAILAKSPRAVAYVACDPAALARDVRYARDAGWDLGVLRAFDAFPMTHHVECVALLTPI